MPKFLSPMLRGAAGLAMAVLALLPGPARAQSVNDLGAWDALMLSPAGALPPQARVADHADRANEWSARFGYWRYDMDDAPHENYGLTYSHDLGVARTRLAFTGAWLAMPCEGCSGWWIGGVEARTNMLALEHHAGNGGTLSADVGFRTAVGAARYRGAGSATAEAMTAALDLGGAVPVTRTIRVTAAVLPGLGYGQIASVDESGHGLRATLGAALALEAGSSLVVDVGIERVAIAGGPAQFGGGFAWRLP